MIAAALQNKKVSVPHDFIVNSRSGVPGTKERSKGHQNEEESVEDMTATWNNGELQYAGSPH